MKTNITSSNIAAADWSNETLTLWFHNGGVYSYFDVPMNVFNDFIHAESQGKFFHAFIKSSFVVVRKDAVADGGPRLGSEQQESTKMVNKVMHTEGPWELLPEECDKPYIRVRGAGLGYRYKVENVVTPTYEGVPPFEVEETRCNARLIAAAPDLLDALRDLVDVMTGRMDGETVALHNALAAMHRAAGHPAQRLTLSDAEC